jgi:hypothetical protein
MKTIINSVLIAVCGLLFIGSLAVYLTYDSDYGSLGILVVDALLAGHLVYITSKSYRKTQSNKNHDVTQSFDKEDE